jgi:hypothetical protein
MAGPTWKSGHVPAPAVDVTDLFTGMNMIQTLLQSGMMQ